MTSPQSKEKTSSPEKEPLLLESQEDQVCHFTVFNQLIETEKIERVTYLFFQERISCSHSKMSIKENNHRSILPSTFNISFKTWILIAICLQNAGYSLTRKYSVKYENVSSKEILIGNTNFILDIFGFYSTSHYVQYRK